MIIMLAFVLCPLRAAAVRPTSRSRPLIRPAVIPARAGCRVGFTPYRLVSRARLPAHDRSPDLARNDLAAGSLG